MKPSIYLLLFLPLFLFSDLNIEKIDNVLSSIKLNNNPITYYSKNRSFFSKLKVKKAQSIDSADIIIFPKKNSTNKMYIVDSYDKLKLSSSNIGAIYVKKGRTQIIFVDERMKNNALKLSNRYNKYIIKECYLHEFCLLK